MRRSRMMNTGRLLSVAAIAGTLALPAAVRAAPPINDNYLQSIRIVDASGRIPVGVVRDVRDTSDATVQTDLFGPDATGGGTEPTLAPAVCGGVTYGRTEWYDFSPVSDGAVELRASGPENVLVLYAFDRATSVLGTELACTQPSTGTDLVQEVRAGRSYTVQVGGVDRGLGPAGGATTFSFELFADADRDGILDALDKCPTFAGIARFGGCPATVAARAAMSLIQDASGMHVTPLVVHGPKGARVLVRCHRKCSGQWAVRIGSARVAKVARVARLALASGAQIDVSITQAGLFGRFLRYTVRASGLRTAFRCLLPVAHPAPLRRCAGAQPTS